MCVDFSSRSFKFTILHRKSVDFSSMNVCLLSVVWSGWWWMSLTNSLRMVRRVSESSLPPSSWPALLPKSAGFSSAQPLPQMWSNGAN